MEILRRVAEDEVIAVFLRAELDSTRFGANLRTLLADDGRDADVVRRPNLADVHENAYRRRLLDAHRAYERREGLFFRFPRGVDWSRAALTRDEVLEILFINWDWWVELSGGSRRPRDAATRIRRGEIAGVTAEAHEPIAAALRSGATPPELIAATTPAHAPLVLVEGHIRLTAYALFPEHVPTRLEILLGVSDEMDRWSEF